MDRKNPHLTPSLKFIEEVLVCRVFGIVSLLNLGSREVGEP